MIVNHSRKEWRADVIHLSQPLDSRRKAQATWFSSTED